MQPETVDRVQRKYSKIGDNYQTLNQVCHDSCSYFPSLWHIFDAVLIEYCVLLLTSIGGT